MIRPRVAWTCHRLGEAGPRTWRRRPSPPLRCLGRPAETIEQAEGGAADHAGQLVLTAVLWRRLIPRCAVGFGGVCGHPPSYLSLGHAGVRSDAGAPFGSGIVRPQTGRATGWTERKCIHQAMSNSSMRVRAGVARGALATSLFSGRVRSNQIPVERLADPTRRVDAVHRGSLVRPCRAHVGTKDRFVVEDRDERRSLLVQDLGGDGGGEAGPPR